MTDTISPEDMKELMRLFDLDYHGWVEEDEPYFLSPPDGWTVSHDMPPWVVVSPEECVLPDQGWKVHVSAVPDTAQQALTVVSDVAFELGVCFKYLSSAADLKRASGKYADRSSAGKFVTLYSVEDSLAVLLDRLEEDLSGFEGPYILSDVQYGSSPVYVRYGAFVSICDVDADGTERLCVRDLDGKLVEDKRLPILQIPDFIRVPDFLRRAVTERLNPTDGALDRLLEGYEFVSPIHFSNGGGVYLLKRADDDSEAIMKEGRPNAGWEPRGTDAVGRVRREALTLRALAPTGVVPTFFGLKNAAGHLFLLEEKVEGVDLHSWTAENYPPAGCGVTYSENYAQKALLILRRLEGAVGAVHNRGFAVMDLQPQNIIVTPENEIRIIDLESACPITDKRPQECIGTPGYVPPVDLYSPLERDYYALFHVGLSLFHPAAGMSALSDDVSQTVMAIVRRSFPHAVTTKLVELQQKASRVMASHFLSNPVVTSGIHGSSDNVDDATEGMRERNILNRLKGLVKGLHLIRTERKLDSEHFSFYPLTDISYGGSRQLAIEHGLAGVMLALGPYDDNAEEDAIHLRDSALGVERAGSGIMNGMLGICLVLASRGLRQEALDLYNRHCKKDSSPNNVSLRSGLSGRVLGSLLLADMVPDDGLRSYSLALLSCLQHTLADPPEELRSPESFTQSPLGLLDGWSGAALAMATAAQLLREPALYEESARAIELDMPNMVIAEGGSLQAVDGSRLMPYLADGSAGMAFALSTIPPRYRLHHDTVLDGAFKACSSPCMLPGLYHGMAGMLLFSNLLASCRRDDLQASLSVDRLSPYLMCMLNSSLMFVPGEGREHLSVDFASGSAGVIFALRLILKCSYIASSSGSAGSWGLVDVVNLLRKGGE